MEEIKQKVFKELETLVNKLCEDFIASEPVNQNQAWNKYIELYREIGHFEVFPPRDLFLKMGKKEEDIFLDKVKDINSKLWITYLKKLKELER